jgi:hypothetical protein
MAIMAAFERVRGEVIVTLDADLQNPPEEIPKLLEKDRRRPRLRRRLPAEPAGLVLPHLRLEAHQLRAREDDEHRDDRPGLHAARLPPPDHRRDRAQRRDQHLHPRAGLQFLQQPGRGRRQARGAPRRRVELLVLQAHPAELRPHHRLLARAAAIFHDVRDGCARRAACCSCSCWPTAASSSRDTDGVFTCSASCSSCSAWRWSASA